MLPQVSVIIPAYNAEKYIAKAIQSVLKQTLDNLEIIIVDDNSTDSTVAIARSYSDPRIKVLTNSENMGAAFSRNRAIKAASGPWIALLDADDWYIQNRLEKLLAVANFEGADMVADDIYHINEGEELPRSTLFTESGEKIDKTMQIDPVYFVNTDLPGVGGLTLGLTKPIIKREFLSKHKIEYIDHIRLGQDFWFYLSCLGNGARFFIVPQAYYFYLNTPGALTKKSQIERLQQYCEASIFFLQQDFIRNNYELSEALSNRLKKLEKTRPYFQVLDTIRKGNLWQIFIDIFQNPYFIVHTIKHLPKKLCRCYRYNLGKFKSTNAISLGLGVRSQESASQEK
jgi:succinoglycan biosynthesis protein ExoO